MWILLALSVGLLAGAHAQNCAGRADVVFVIDSSGSVGQTNFVLVLDFINAIIDSLTIGEDATRVGAVTFESQGVKRFDLNTFYNKDDLKNAVSNIPFIFGSTATWEGIDLMLQMFDPVLGDRTDVQDVGIIITDGNAKTADPIPKAQEAMQNGINMFAIAINTGELDTTKIRPLANNTETNYFEVQDFSMLSEITEAVSQSTAICETVCPGTQADVAFVLDSSGSLSTENFIMMKTFIKTVVQSIDIGEDAIKVGVISFSNIARIDFNLNAFTSANDILNAVDPITQIGAGTATDLAMDMLVDTFFTEANGDRSFAPNIAFVITDGVSDEPPKTASSAVTAQNSGISVFAIGVGGLENTGNGGLDIDELNAIATDPDFANVRILDSYEALQTISSDVALETCYDPVCAQRQADVVFVLDASGSITAESFDTLKNFMRAVVNRMDIDAKYARIGAMTFSDSTQIFWNLNTYSDKASVLLAIDGITQSGGTTHTADAIRVARDVMFTPTNGDRRTTSNIMILVTDGASKDEDPVPEAASARAAGIEIFCLAIGPDFGPEGEVELRAIASSPVDGHLFTVLSFNNLNNIAGQISQVACRVNVCGGEKYDITVLLDRSGSIPEDDYLLMLDFISSVTNDLDISPLVNQVAMVSFSSDVQIIFNLNTYDNRADVRDAILAIDPSTEGATNHADALAATTDVIFSTANGDRADAMNVIIMFTDGKSTVNVNRTRQEALRAQAKASVFVIGIGPELTPQDIANIASSPSERYTLQVTSFFALNDIRNVLLQYACEQLDDSCSGRGDIVLVVDASGSIGQANFDLVKSFLRSLMMELTIGVGGNNIGMVTFSDAATVRFQLNAFANVDAILTSIDNTPYTKGATATADALSQARGMFTAANGDRNDAANIVVVVTDGVSTVNKPNTIPAAVASRNAGISIATVAIGPSVDDLELLQVASNTGMMFAADTFNDLPSIVTNLRTAICNDVNECDSNPCQNGGTCYDRLGYYQCECPISVSGYDCEIICDVNVDLVIAMDTSGSIFETNFELMKTFVSNIILDLPVSASTGSGTRVGVITFASSAQIQFNLNTFDKRDAINAMSGIAYTGGATNTASALQLVRLSMFTSANGDRPDAKNVVLLMTDGSSNVNRDDTLPQAKLLRSIGAHIMAVGVGHELKPRELRGMATDPDTDNVMIVNNFQDLPTLRSPINSPICYEANECANNPCQGGATCIDGINRYECICPVGRAGDNCELSCGGQADVVFVIDSSGSIGQDNFDKVIAFVSKVVSKMEISNDQYRIGIVTFADDGVIQFDLDDFKSRSNYLNAIRAIEYTQGATNTARGIELMRSVFTIVNGDRSAVPNTIVFLTDGVPTVRKGEERTQIDLAKSAGITVKTVGVGSQVDTDLLEYFTTAPAEDNLVLANNFDDLDFIADTIDMCTP